MKRQELPAPTPFSRSPTSGDRILLPQDLSSGTLDGEVSSKWLETEGCRYSFRRHFYRNLNERLGETLVLVLEDLYHCRDLCRYFAYLRKLVLFH